MNPIASYETIDKAYPWRLRGAAYNQSDTGLLMTQRTALAGGTSAQALRGFALGYFGLQNRSGSTGACGIGVRIPNDRWIAGAWDDSETTAFTDDTTDAQDTGTADFPLETLTNDDGFVVASDVQFNAISIDIGTASAGTDPVRAVRYTDPEGDGWVNFTNMIIQDGATTDWAATGTTDANEVLLVWNVPANWGKTQSSGLSGIPRDKYAINVRATTAAGTTAAVADSMSIYRIYFPIEGLADNGLYEFYPGGAEIWMPDGDGLVALFETANNQNQVRALVRQR